MSRFSSKIAYHFRLRYIFSDTYKISWAVDYYYHGSMLRYPRAFSRITDEKGAKRFNKKHNLNFSFETNEE